jgi:uncharacterized surface protein with fasciclin (FAS1) repeats
MNNGSRMNNNRGTLNNPNNMNNRNSMNTFNNNNNNSNTQNNSTNNMNNTDNIEDKKPTYNTLIKLIKTADLDKYVLDNVKDISILAPNDEVFNKVPKPVTDYLVDPKNKTALRDVLENHILKKKNNLGNDLPTFLGVDKVLVPNGYKQTFNNLSK